MKKADEKLLLKQEIFRRVICIRWQSGMRVYEEAYI